MWQRYCDPGDRHRALRMEKDDLGYVWLVAGEGGRRVWLADQDYSRAGIDPARAPEFFAGNINFFLRT